MPRGVKGTKTTKVSTRGRKPQVVTSENMELDESLDTYFSDNFKYARQVQYQATVANVVETHLRAMFLDIAKISDQYGYSAEAILKDLTVAGVRAISNCKPDTQGKETHSHPQPVIVPRKSKKETGTGIEEADELDSLIKQLE